MTEPSLYAANANKNPVEIFHDRITSLPEYMAMLICLGTGLIANLGFAPVNAWPAYFLALTIMVWMMDGAAKAKKPGWSAFCRAGLFGIGFFGVGFHWIANAFLVDQEAYGHMVWLVGLLIGGYSLFWATAFGLSIRLWRTGMGRLPVFALSLIGIEYVRGCTPFGGMPWNIPGMVWTPGSAMSQTASLVGIWGLSAITVFLFCIPACLVGPVKAPDHGSLTQDSRKALIGMATFLTLISMWGWGAQRLARAPAPDPDAPIVRIIDAGVPQKEKYVRSNGPKILKHYIDMTGPERPDDPEDPDIIVWPEVATPYLLLQSAQALDIVAKALGNRFLIAGTARNEKTSDNTVTWYNSLAVISGESFKRGPLAIYDKYKLVPFGEYVPLSGIASKLNISSIQYLTKNGFRRGLPPESIALGPYPTFVPLICYEALFSGLAPRSTPRPKWLVNISIDTWFGELMGPAQHFSHARYRAIEEGLPLARSASGGHSGMIDAYGRVTALAKNIEVKGNTSMAWTASAVNAILPKALKITGFVLGWNKIFVIFFVVFNCWLFVSARQ